MKCLDSIKYLQETKTIENDSQVRLNHTNLNQYTCSHIKNQIRKMSKYPDKKKQVCCQHIRQQNLSGRNFLFGDNNRMAGVKYLLPEQ